jgi:1-acyl-sn-glycerol-3-phosphate acyltransferase
MLRLPDPEPVLLRKAARNLTGVLTFAACTVNTVICFAPIFVLAIVKLLIPIEGIRKPVTGWLMAIGEAWVACNARLFSLVNDTDWDVRGLDELAPDNWYLLLANHQTWLDIVVMQTVFNRRIPFLKFFIKQELVWFPFLGIAWWALDMPFMKRYSKSYLARHPEKKGKDLEATRRACRKFRTLPTSVINFVEGTRFTEEKRLKRNSPFQHLLPPRAGGVALALSSMGTMFDALLDVTLVYPDGPVTFWDMLCGDLRHVIVDVRRYGIEPWLHMGDYENDREFRKRFHQWLAALWHEKDRRITALLAARG